MTDVALRQQAPRVGELLRRWRERRGMSQLALAMQAEVSTRHLSFVETGRSMPSKDMIARLAEHLELQPHELDLLLLSGGYAPLARGSDDLPSTDVLRASMRTVVAGHLPFPALVVDRDFALVEANAAVEVFTDGVAPELLAQPVNVMRMALDPAGMAPRIVNLQEWRGQLLGRLWRKANAIGAPSLLALCQELAAHELDDRAYESAGRELTVPLRIEFRGEVLSFFCTVATFCLPQEVASVELSIESFLPVDARTREILSSRYSASDLIA